MSKLIDIYSLLPLSNNPGIVTLHHIEMDPSTCKNYQTDDIMADQLYATYFSPTVDKNLLNEAITFPMTAIHNYCKTGLVKGEVLVDISTGATPYQLFTLYKCFKKVIILEANDCCVEDSQKWLNKHPGAYHWGHAAKIAAELEGNSDNGEGIEDDLRRHVEQVIKCNLDKENPTDPFILQKADCVISLYLVGDISTNLESYCHNMGTLCKMLKIGGRLIVIGTFGASHYTVGEHKYNMVTINEKDLGKAMCVNGLTIEHLEVMKSKVPNDDIWYEHVFVVGAVKNKEVDAN
uniref:Nicotinamide N-methyltransferase n=1 Tax=Leptobrachium leishanense TaxID=445787 RepID=A0A8C5RAJ3_9ANUR